MDDFQQFVPQKSNQLLQSWVSELMIDVKITKPRIYKLGDFKVQRNRFKITINNNLNKYLFLITLTHELAHAFVFKKYQNKVSPHGKVWKLTFKSLMLNFLNPDCFPKDVLQALSSHMINPKASTFADLELVRVLKKYDQVKSFTIADVDIGDYFQIASGRIFIKGRKNRKRYKCVESATNKTYLFHPFAEVIRVL